MKRKMQRVLALILSLVMCLGLCPVGAFAAEPALSAELSKTTMNAGAAETITLTVKLGETTEKLSLMEIDVFSEDANGTDAGFSPVEDGLSVAGGQGYATLNTTTKHINWISVTELTGISTLLTVKVSVPATAKAGTYKIGVKNVTIGDDTEDWMSDGTAYATLIIEEPAAAKYGVDVAETTNGTVTADKAEAAEGDTVTLTVAPATDYKLQTLTVTDAEVTKVNDTTYTFVMPASDVTVSAAFAQAKELTIKTNGEGTVTADMASAYVGEKITFTITPAEGYRLGSIRIAGTDHTASVVDGKLEYTLGNGTGLGVYVEATFVPVKLTVVVSGYEAGKSVTTLQASETALGLSFTYGRTMGICTAQSLDNLMESGSFETGKDYWLLLTSSNNSFAGYTAADISVTGVENAVVTVEEMEGTAFVWIKLPQLAEAAPSAYGITIGATTNGTVTADKAEAAEGETVTLTISPDIDYELDTLTVDGADVTAQVSENKYTFTMPAKDVNVAATFKAFPKGTYTITVNVNGKGTVTANRTTASAGDTVIFTITPEEGYKLGAITFAGSNQAANVVDGKLSYTWPSYSPLVAATFIPNQVTVNLTGYELCKNAQDIGVTADGVTLNAYRITAASGNTSKVSGMLKADTQYYLLVQMLNASYTADEITLTGVEGAKVSQVTPNGNNLNVWFELPKLQIPEDANISVSATENGTVEVSTYKANAGDTVTLTVTPDSGYSLESLTVLDASGEKIDVSSDYTFKMPASAVTISATFVKSTVVWKLGEATGKPGEVVEVSLTIESNVSAKRIRFTPQLPSGWGYPNNNASDVTLGENSSFSSMSKGQVNFSGANRNSYYTDLLTNSVAVNGETFTIKVKIPDGTAAGEYEINFYGLGNKNGTSLLSSSSNAITCDATVVPGKVTVEAGETFSISIAEGIENGTVTADKVAAQKGETVTLTVTPAEGYSLTKLTYTPEGGEAVDITAAKSFKMPEANVTIDAEFCKHTFTDGLCGACGAVEDGAYVVYIGDVQAAPGEVVEVPIRFLTNGTPAYVNLQTKAVTFDAAGIAGFGANGAAQPDSSTWKMGTGWGFMKNLWNANMQMLILNCEPFKTAEMSTVQLKIKDDAAPGNYTFTMTLMSGGTDSSSTGYVHAGTITVAEPQAHSITIGETTDGTVTADKTAAKKGETVTLTVTPRDKYELDTLTVSGVEVTKKNVSTYTFTMPDQDVSVSASFKVRIAGKIYIDNVVDAEVSVQVGGEEVTDAKEGETVTLSFTPHTGYAVESVYIVGDYGIEVKHERVDDNTYTFVMPACDVVVEASFRNIVVADKTLLQLDSPENSAYPGDMIAIPVSVGKVPGGNYAFFRMNIKLPEGWSIVGGRQPNGGIEMTKPGEVEGASDITGKWIVMEDGFGSWGLWAQYPGSLGLPFPSDCELYELLVKVSPDAAPGVYKLDLVSGTVTMGQSESVDGGFAQYGDSYVRVASAPDTKVELTKPAITDGMIIAYEDLLEARNIPLSPQDAGAVVEYRFAESKDALENAKWIEGIDVVAKYNMGSYTDDAVTWLIEQMPPAFEPGANHGPMKANTKYYLQIRYRAFNTTVYNDYSDPVEMEVTTKAWIEEPVKITTTGATARPSETFTVTMNWDHGFGDKEFITKDYDFKFNNEQFTLEKIEWNSHTGRTLPEGDVAVLTIRVKDDVEAGEYDLELTSSKPFYLRYNREGRSDGTGYYKHNREYPVNYEFTSAKITVLARLEAPVLSGYTATDDSITVTPPATVEGASIQYAISTKADETSFDWKDSNVFTGLDEQATYYVYARYVVPADSTAANSAASAALKVMTVNPTAAYTVESVTAQPGGTVEVAVTLEHSIVKQAMIIELEVDAADGLTLQNVALGEDATDWSKDETGNQITLYKTALSTVPEGEILVLTFKVTDDAAIGSEYAVSLKNMNFTLDGTDELRVDSSVTAGKVTVIAEPSYSVSVASDITNGTVTVDKTTAKAKETVTVTVSDITEGYVLDTITVNGDAIEGTTFTMPAENVTVSATFKKIFSVTKTPAGVYSGSDTVKQGASYRFTVSSGFDAAHAAPVVTMGGTAATVSGSGTAGSPWVVKNVTGDLVITTPKHSVSFTGEEGITCPPNTEAHYGEDYRFTMPSVTGYTVSFTMTIGGEDYTGYTKNGSEIVIPGTAVTGDVVVSFTKQSTSNECPNGEHSFGAVTYRWSSDNSSCTASRSCANCPKVETETVETTCVTNADGSKTYTANFSNPAFATQTKEVAAPVVSDETIRVSFRLIGDGQHSNGVSDHDEYVTWIPTTSYTMQDDDTVYDLFVKAMDDYNLSYREGKAAGGYISDIKAPSVLGGYWLGEFDNGPKSGWMYTLNGKDADVVKTQDLDNGDAIVFHYTDDYTLETVSGTYYTRWLEAKDITPEKYVELYGKDEDKKDEENKDEENKDIEFVDVKKSDWFYDEVQYAVSNGLFNGVGNDKFDPNGSMTRAMLVTVLYRLEGEPTVRGTSPFSDVSNNIWYTDAVIWAEDNAIVNGVGDNKFDPNSSITREQMAAVLFRYAQYKKYDASASNGLSKYSDFSSISAWSLNALKWANAESLITGRTATTLAPKGTATRAEVAAILYRFVENVVNK